MRVQTGQEPKVESEQVSPNGVVEPKIEPKAAGEQDLADDLEFSDSQKEYIKKLREENAKYRTKAKEFEKNHNDLASRFSKFEQGLKSMVGGDEQELSPEETIEKLNQENYTVHAQASLLEMAYENEIPKQGLEFFQFLITKKINELSEGEELSEEDLEEIVAKAKASTSLEVKKTSTSVSTAGKAPTTGGESIGLSEFVKMSMGEKTVLYKNNPDEYSRLMEAAKKERRLL